MSTAIFLCAGQADECWNCGGWVHADGCVPKGESPIAGHYCSEECHDEALTFAERARRAAASDWCPECGFDNHEHNQGCPKLALMHPVPRKHARR